MDSDDDNDMITIESLQAESGVTDDQLDQKCPVKHLKKVAPYVENYLKFAARFNLPPAVKSDIKNDVLLNFQQKTETVFEWWSSNVRNATYRNFMQACIDLSKGDIARKMSKLCAKGTVSASSKESRATLSPKSDDPPPTKHPRADPEPPTGSSKEEDENNEELQQFCTAGEDILEQEDTGPLNVLGALPGSARRHLLWDVKQIPELKVHFLNDDLLGKEKWKCGSSQLTINNVLDWADVWNGPAEYYPKISDEIAAKEKAQIRVLFTSNRKSVSWSKVGTAATWETDTTKPTMVLNLTKMTKAEQRSMVIHEFGHALGLDHEHQRSDFWDVLERKDKDDQFRFIIGINEMKKGIGCRPACPAVFRADHEAPEGTEKTEKTERTNYDSQSIMHYWFDKNWLKPEYRDLKDIRKNQTLDDRERKVLEGVHARDYRTGGRQAKNPSKLDYETLNKAYSVLTQQEKDEGPSQADTGVSHGPTTVPPPSLSSAKNSESITDITLTVSHTMTLLEVLQQAQEKWHYIGKGIGVSEADLTQIDHSYRPDTLRCLEEILKRRIQRGGLTRSMLCQCLRGKFVKRDDVAQEIEALKLN